MRIDVPLPARTAWRRSSVKALFEAVRRPPRDEDGVVTAFRDGEVTLRTNRRVEGFTNAIAEHGYQGIRRGDLVIHSMDGFAGAIGVSEADGKASPVVHAYRPLQGNDPRFFAYLLRELARSGFITSLAKGIRERSTAFDAATFRSLVLHVPPPDGQCRIADFLDAETARIDALIARKRRIIELAEERRVARIEWSILHNHAPKRTVASLARYINGWPFKPTDFTVDGLPVIRIRQLVDEEAEADRYDKCLPDRVLLRDEDLVFSWSGSLEVRLWRRGPAWLNQHLFRVLPAAGVDRKWLLFALDCATRLFEPYMHGSAMTHITQPMMKFIRVPVPDIDEQVQVAEILSSESRRLGDLVNALRRQIELLRERRQALITHAVTGQIPVPS